MKQFLGEAHTVMVEGVGKGTVRETLLKEMYRGAGSAYSRSRKEIYSSFTWLLKKN